MDRKIYLPRISGAEAQCKMNLARLPWTNRSTGNFSPDEPKPLRSVVASPVFPKPVATAMRELNPLYNQIKDLKSRDEALRGYL